MDTSIRRILIPTDFSPPARQAEHYAVALAQKFAAELHIVHVVEDPALPVHGSRYSWAVPDDILPRLLEKAEHDLKLAVPTADVNMISQSLVRKIKVGHPVNSIIEYATENQIDLIVIGTHGRSGLTHLLLGSSAEKLVRLATCPVLTVHPSGHQFVETSSNEQKTT